ncbi:MAG: hypothetical protein ABR985_03535 [Methanotrichaceae archaeon]|jgi:uncharacterized membrane protein
MSPRFFSKSEAVLFGWNTLKKNFGFFLGMLAIVVAINLLVGLVMSSFSEEAPKVLVIAVSAISWILDLLISMGVIRITLKFCDQEQATYRDLFSAYRLLLNYLVGSIVYGIMVAIGFVFLIAPGIYLAVKYQFYDYLIIDKGMGPIDAIKRSGVLTEGVKRNLVLFWLALVGINILGMIALGVGLIATVPVSWLANAYVYRRLQLQAENNSAIPLAGLD